MSQPADDQQVVGHGPEDGPDDLSVHDSSGNVFADFGLPDAEARLAKAELARVLRDRVGAAMAEHGWSQAAVAAHVGAAASDLSDLMRGRLARFSQERLATYLHALGMDVRIVVSPTPEPGARGHTRVEVAEAA